MWLVAVAVAGGGPMSTQVLYDANDPDSVALALAYAEARDVPENRLCGLQGPFEPVVDLATFESTIKEPWEACRRDDTDVLVLVKGLPYRVTLSTFHASLEAVLQVGNGTQSGEVVVGRGQSTQGSTAYASVNNPAVVYAGHISSDFTLSNPTQSYYTTTSGLVRQAWPVGFSRQKRWEWGSLEMTGELLVVSRLDGWTFDDAHALIERALLAESAVPEGEWLCMAASDGARGPRDPECEFAVRKLAELGVEATWLPSFDATLSDRTVLAYFTGSANLKGAIDGLEYAPGAFADNLTSYGAVPDNFCETCTESQTSIARFVRAGASAAHGTVAEPLNNVFPNAGTLLLYSQGYALGESVLYNQRHLYWQNLLLGDPLMTPFDERPTVSLWAPAQVGVPAVFSGQHPRGIESMEVWQDGELLVEGDGDFIEVLFSEEGSEEVVVIAVALGHTETVPWPMEEVTIDPRTQGWGVFTVEVGPAPVDTGDSGQDTGQPTEDCGGCGTPLAVPVWTLVALGMWTRRRRQDGA